MEKNTDSGVINNSIIENLQQEIEEIQVVELDEESRTAQLNDKNQILKIASCLKQYADENEFEPNFVILQASQFNSGFGKPDFPKINIVFKTKQGEKITNVGKIVSSLTAREKERDNFFYLFYKRNDENNDNNIIDKEEICIRLFKALI